MATPAIIFKMSFNYNWHIGGYDFLEYMNRPEAFNKTAHLRDEYKDFIDYMSNTEKSDGLFDAASDLLDEQEIEQYRRQEEQSQAEGCPKYYGVISFDNDFLIDNGVMTSDGRLDVGLLKELTRDGMSQLISTSNKLSASNVYWNAAIHTNTDNIHVHYALCEYHRLEDRQRIYRDKDMIEQPAFNALKSRVLNRIVGKEFVTELTKLEREVLLDGIKHTAPSSKEQLAQLAAILPPEGGWQYGRKKMKPYLSRIDECVDKIIRSDESLFKSYEEYIKRLDERTVTIKENFYGSNKTQLYLAYKRKKLADFYNRAGNIVLKAIEEAEQEQLVGAGAPIFPRERPLVGAEGLSHGGTPVASSTGTAPYPASKKRPSFRAGNLAEWNSVRHQHARPPHSSNKPSYHLPEEEQSEVPQGRFNRALSAGKYILDWNSKYKKAVGIIYAADSTDEQMKEAKDIFLSESNRGNVLAMCELAKLEKADGNENRAHELNKEALEGFTELLAAAPPKKKPYLQYRLGKMYLYGVGTDIDYDKAYGYINEAALAGNQYAEFTMGSMYRYGTGTALDYQEALLWYERSAAKGQPYAAYASASLMEQLGNHPQEVIDERYRQALSAFLALDTQKKADDEMLSKIGLMYLKGKGTEIDIEAAERYLDRASKLKNSKAAYALGCLYIEKDELDKAIIQLTAAEEQKNGYAAYRLAKLYLDSTNEIYDVNKAIEHLNKAATLDMMTAYLSLGKIYSDSNDKEHYDIRKAIASYETAYSDTGLKTYAACKLAKLYLIEGENRSTERAIEVLEGVPDNPFASVMLGKIYSDPEYKEQYNVGKAIEAYERAYASDDSFKEAVAYRLAKLYLTEGENRDDLRAVELLTSIADIDTNATFLLGRLYYNGTVNIEQDRNKGRQLIEAAAEGGNEYAKRYLDYLDRSTSRNRNSPAAPNISNLISATSGVARNTYLMMSRIYRDMERHHSQTLREFEREQAINDMRGRAY